MTDLSALGITAPQREEWVEYFRGGQAYTVPKDEPGVARRMRNNTTVLVVVGFVAVAAVAGLITAVVTDFGRVLTYVMLGLLVVGTLFVWLKFRSARRRLRAVASSSDDYLVVSAEGIRLAGAIDLPWSSITGGVGFDGRTTGGRLAARVSRAAGVVESEFILGVRGVRALRDGVTPALHGLFEVGGDRGGVRIPIDIAVAPDFVPAALAAIAVSGASAGKHTVVSGDRGVVMRMTFAALGDPDKFDEAVQG